MKITGKKIDYCQKYNLYKLYITDFLLNGYFLFVEHNKTKKTTYNNFKCEIALLRNILKIICYIVMINFKKCEYCFAVVRIHY